MKKTLEAFIEPANIPKKYGGELDFNFGDLPVLDPALEDVLKWEDGREDFPHGPMYWLKQGETTTGDQVVKEMKAIAVGFKAGQERKEEVCTITTTLRNDEDMEYTNGSTALASIDEKQKYPESRPELITLPTETETPSQVPSDPPAEANGEHTPQLSPGNSKLPETATPVPTASENGLPPSGNKVVMENGEVVPASRPEPTSFITATEDLTLKEQSIAG